MTWRGFFLRALVLCALTLTGPVLMAQAADAPAALPPTEAASTAAPAATTASRDEETRARNTTAAAAAVTLGKDRAPARAPDFLENLVDGALRLFHVKNTGGNTTAHFVISLLFVALAPGASVDVGFNGTHTGGTGSPTAFTLNGAACTTA